MDVGQDLRRSLASHPPARLNNGRWPARAQQLIETSYTLCVEALYEPARRCIGAFEKELFVLADHAHRVDEQHEYFASRQRVLQGQGNLVQSFMEQVGKALNELDRAALTFQQRGGAVKALSPKARPFCDRQVVPTEGGLRGSLLHAVPVP